MPSPKRVLGRGLADLIPVGGGGADALTSVGPGQEVSLGLLHPNPRQPRNHFDEAALEELANSIRANGILQPILVRPRPTGGYEIVAGERRFRAAKKAGLTQVPVVVRPLTDEDTLALGLIENLVREDLSPIETARAFHRLMEDYGWTQEEMGKRVGKSRSAVANSLRLLRLPEVIQHSLERGEITEGHARILIGDDEDRSSAAFRSRQLQIFEQIKLNGLSVREVERLMRNVRTGQLGTASSSGNSEKLSDKVLGSKAAFEHSPDVEAILEQLRDALGTRIRLTGSMEKGRIEIEYFSPEELDGLIERLTGRSSA
jgi:ParB family transcriptional regulator, chromosome partitioning protein